MLEQQSCTKIDKRGTFISFRGDIKPLARGDWFKLALASPTTTAVNSSGITQIQDGGVQNTFGMLIVQVGLSSPGLLLTFPVGTPDLFKYAQCSVFTVKPLGHLGNVQSHRGAESAQGEILEIIDAAQVRMD